MIKINSSLNLEDYGLLLQDGVLNINKSISEPIYIDEALDINVLADAYIIDVTKDCNLNVTVGENVNLNYQMIHTDNSKHKFVCSGNLNVMQISINETEEELFVELVKENASCNVELLSLGYDCKKVFIQNICHNALSTVSNISNFGVSMNGSDITFDTTGKIISGMAKSVCRQLSKGIVMDDDSSVTSKPILLIDEYDVVANHGASIGKLSDESLFYLMSRGLTKLEAFLLILDGIIKPFIDRISNDELKESIDLQIKTLIKR